MSQWVESLRSVGERGQNSVVVTLVSGKGSTPRDAGAKMIVTLDGIHGTIGGGDVEYQAAGIARDMLQATDGKRSRRFPLGADLGQYCGGVANLVFERVPAGASWVGVLEAWLESGERCVLVTLEQEQGDGGRMLVCMDETSGTLGRADLDARAKEHARRMLAAQDRVLTMVQLDGGPSALFEPVVPVDFNVVLFGAGHVGRAVVKVFSALPLRITWVDAREHEFPRDIPGNVRVVLTDRPLDQVTAARPGASFLVMTHSHALDLDLVEAILKRPDIAYCGMIGSDTKRRTFETGLAKRGLGSAELSRFTCPIGITSLTGKDPGTIAVAIAAQLLEQRERQTGEAEAAALRAGGKQAR